MHRVVLVHRLPRLAVIDGILITEEERNKAELYYTDQTQVLTVSYVYLSWGFSSESEML